MLYDLPVSMTVYYKNTFSIIDSVSAMTGCPGTLTLTNPYSPATNTVALKYLWGQYKVFSVNTGCNMFYNAPYNTTISLPIKQIDAMSDGFFYTPIGTFSGIKYNPVPICNNIGADSVSMYYEIMNLYTCNSTLASKTFSLYFDGLIFDQITVVSSSNYFSGTKSKMLNPRFL